MTAVGIIPARWASTRFPGKALALIDGIPMIERVWRGASACRRLREVVVATDDERIAAHCTSIGARVVMTRADHPTGSDRIAEVAEALSDDVVVNIQGDEPLIEPFVIEAALDALEGPLHADVATVAHPLHALDRADPNRVKVVFDALGRALYFSRALIPPVAGTSDAPAAHWQHVGLYAYRRSFLLDFVKLERGPLERAEALEQLRVLENGRTIRVGLIEGWESTSVDVPADVARVEAALRARAGA